MSQMRVIRARILGSVEDRIAGIIAMVGRDGNDQGGEVIISRWDDIPGSTVVVALLDVSLVFLGMRKF